MRRVFVHWILIALITLIAAAAHAPQPLSLNVYVADENGWCVTSTLIRGKTESILVDTQFLQSQASRVADRIAASGTRLKAIIITHPHDDHYLGAATIHRRFPDVPIYMTVAGIERFNAEAPRVVDWLKKNMPDEAPDAVPPVTPLTADRFEVDGQSIEIKQGQGDEEHTTSSFVWIPSLRAVVAGDIVFNGVHPWLANSSEQSRGAWVDELKSLTEMHPRVVV